MAETDLTFLLNAKDQASATIDGLRGKIGKLGPAMRKAGTAMTGAGAAITGALGASTKMAADFDGAMREVNTMMLLNEEDFAGFKKETLDMARALGVDAVKSSQALYQAISAGVPKENAIDFLTVATKAAIGGVTDTETAVDGLSTVMNSFKIPVEDTQRVADLMFTTIKGGKCVVGSTRVLLADGRYERIDNLQEGGDVVSYDGRSFQIMPAQWVDQGIKETVTIRTRLGREITTTWNHPYLSKIKNADYRSTKQPEWRLVSELNIGDSIAIPTALPYFGPTKVPDYEASLLGLWLAEGAGGNSTPRLTTGKYAAQLKEWVANYDCHAVNLEKREGKTPTYSLTTGKMNGGHKVNPVYGMLSNYGVADCTSASKHIPTSVFTWKRDSIAVLLHWLFNGDGWFTAKEGKRSKFQIGFVSKSETLVRDVSHLLLRFGIVGRVRNRGNCFVWETDRYFEVSRFVEFIGIDRPGVDEVLSFIPQKEKARWGVVEYDPIVEIQSGTPDHVYDLCVKELHNFIANDIIAHNTTFEELSASLFQVAPMAATAGISFDEVSAGLATMTKQGVPTNVATTQLRQSIQAMIKPTDEMKGAIEAAGYVSGDAMLESLGFAETLNTLRDASGGSNEILGKMFGSVEGLQAVLALTGENAEMFATDLDAMSESEGAAIDAFNEMEKSAGRQMEALKSSMQGIAITVGDELLPVLSDIVEQIKPVIQSIVDWIKANPELFATIITVVGVVGALMLALGPLLIMLPGIIAALPVLGAAFAVLTGPVGLIIAAIVALIAIGVLLWKNWDTIKAKTIEIWNGIVGFFKGIWDTIVGFFKANWDKILTILFPAVGILALIARNWEPILGFFRGLWDNVTGVFRSAWDGIVGVVRGSVNSILGFINAMIGGMERMVNGIARAINAIPRFSIPDWLPSWAGGGKTFGLPEVPTVSLPRIPLMDAGGMIQGPGLFAVGRGVKEIVRAPGSSITNKFNIEQLIVREEADIRKIARELYNMQQTRGNISGY